MPIRHASTTIFEVLMAKKLWLALEGGLDQPELIVEKLEVSHLNGKGGHWLMVDYDVSYSASRVNKTLLIPEVTSSLA
jgi:hypothetical protein